MPAAMLPEGTAASREEQWLLVVQSAACHCLLQPESAAAQGRAGEAAALRSLRWPAPDDEAQMGFQCTMKEEAQADAQALYLDTVA